MHRSRGKQKLSIDRTEEGTFSFFPDTSRFDVGIEVGFCIVVSEHLIILSSFFHEAELPALSGLEIVFNFHRDGSSNSREAIDHHADECAVAKADDRIRFDGIQELTRFLGAE